MSNTANANELLFSAASAGKHGPTLLSKFDAAHQLFIADPLYFPWELLHTAGTPTPLVVDVSLCSPNDIIALRPMLSILGPHDCILNVDSPNDPVARSLSHEFGTRSEFPTPVELVALRHAKIADQHDAKIVSRLSDTFHLTVVGWDEFNDHTWTDVSLASDSDGRPGAIVVRVPGSVVRHARTGFVALLDRLVSAVGDMGVVDVSGVRTEAGAPLSRALVTLASIS